MHQNMKKTVNVVDFPSTDLWGDSGCCLKPTILNLRLEANSPRLMEINSLALTLTTKLVLRKTLSSSFAISWHLSHD